MNENDKKIEKLKELIEKSNKILFVGGAGVAYESGILDFRSEDGINNPKYDYADKHKFSATYLVEDVDKFYRYYFSEIVVTDKQPNVCHLKLVELEKQGKLIGIITQNIDGLHKIAGSKNVVEVNGSIYEYRCTNCRKIYSLDELKSVKNFPICDCENCDGFIRPNVVLYQEGHGIKIIKPGAELAQECDLLIMGGTSITVSPVVAFFNFAKNAKRVIINETPTKLDDCADLVINQPIGEVFNKL